MKDSEFALHAQLEDQHWWFTGRRTVLADILHRFVPPGADKLVAEVGCGTGGNLLSFSREYRVIGCDLSAAAVAHARSRVDCPVLEGDFAACLEPVRDEIAALLLLDVLEHLDDDAAFLGRLAEFLPSGRLLLLTVPAHPFLWSSHDVVLGHRRRYRADELQRLWSGLPFTQRFFSPFNALLFPPMAAYRLLGLGKRGADESNLRRTPALLNAALHRLFAVERHWLRHWPLPFGASYCAVLQRR